MILKNERLLNMRIINRLLMPVIIVTGLWISSCGEDVQLPNKILEGTIDSVEWTFQIGKALGDQTDRIYNVSLFNFVGFSENEGCLLFGANSQHITVEIPFNTRNGARLDATIANLIFHLDGVNALTADQGFVEVSFINNTEIRGFISAGSSDSNFVEGFFSVLICN